MKDKAIDILRENPLMAIATLRPDGWLHSVATIAELV